MNIAKTFGNIIDLLRHKGDSVIGLDFGGSSIKVVQARKKEGRAILETYGEIALGPYIGMDIGRAVRLPQEKSIEALEDLLRESNTTTKEGGVAIPLSSSIVNLIQVPKVSDEDFERIVTMEARKYIPVPISEVSLDWQIVSRDSKGNFFKSLKRDDVLADAIPIQDQEIDEVLVVAVHKDVIGSLQNILNQTGVVFNFMELESFSVARSLISSLESTVMIVDHGASSTKIYIFEDGALKVSHNISIGSQDVTLAISRSTGVSITEAERIKRSEGFDFKNPKTNESRLFYGSLSYVFSEIIKTGKEYQTKYGKVIQELILTGGGIHLKGFKEAIEKSIDLPVKIAHPFQKIEYPAFMDKVIKDAGPSFSVATGAVLRALENQG